MSFNTKHYVVMAVGLVVLTGFMLHKPKKQERVSFDQAGKAMTSLSSIKSTTNDPPQPLRLTVPDADQFVEAPKIDHQTNIESVQSIDDWQLDFAQSDEPINNDVAAPPVETDAKIELASNQVDQATQAAMDGLEEVETDFQIELETTSVESANTQPTMDAPSTTDAHPSQSAFSANGESSVVRHFQRPNSRWKRNPFLDQQPTTNQGMKTTAAADRMRVVKNHTTAPTASSMPATQLPIENSIIIEPNDSVASLLEAESFAPTQQPSADNFEIELSPSAPQELSVLANAPTAPPERVASRTEFPPYSNETQSHERTIPDLSSNNSIAPKQITIPDDVAQQAAHHIEYGKSLARRGASQAAGQEFLSALKVVAQANDMTANSNQFSVALADAVLAMKEARDFATQNVQAQMVTEVSRITQSHRTKIISDEQAKKTSPMMAMEKYYAFAQQKIDEAGGRNAVSAEALYCLGKLHTSMIIGRSVPNKTDIAKAMTYHQAALLCDGNNFRSANELGVLLARKGQLATAAGLFKQSLIANPTPQTWQNLAKTHHRLGQQNLAQLAETESSMATQNQLANASSSIVWMTSQKFNDQPRDFLENTRVANAPKLPTPTKKPADADSKKTDNKSFGQVLKKLF